MVILDKDMISSQFSKNFEDIPVLKLGSEIYQLETLEVIDKIYKELRKIKVDLRRRLELKQKYKQVKLF